MCSRHKPEKLPAAFEKKKDEQMQGFIASLSRFVSVKSCENYEDSQDLRSCSYSSIPPFLPCIHFCCWVPFIAWLRNRSCQESDIYIYKSLSVSLYLSVCTYLIIRNMHGSSLILCSRSGRVIQAASSCFSHLRHCHGLSRDIRMRALCRASVSLSSLAADTPKSIKTSQAKTSLFKTTQAISDARRQLHWQRALEIFHDYTTRETYRAKPWIEMPLINTTITAARCSD